MEASTREKGLWYEHKPSTTNHSTLTGEREKICWGSASSTLRGILGQHHTKMGDNLAEDQKTTAQETVRARFRSELCWRLEGNKTICAEFMQTVEYTCPQLRWGGGYKTRLEKLNWCWGWKDDSTNCLGRTNNASHFGTHLSSGCCWYSLLKSIAF